MRVGGRCAPRVWMSCSYFIWEALLISQHSTHCHFSNPCLPCTWLYFVPLTIIEKLSIYFSVSPAAAAAKSLQSCPTLCDHIDGSPPGSPVSGILQALEWVAISFSNAWKWKVKGKSLSRVRLLATPRTATHQAPPSMGFSRQEDWSGAPLPSLIYALVYDIHFSLSGCHSF